MLDTESRRGAEITISPLEALPGGTVRVTGTCDTPDPNVTEALLSLTSRGGPITHFDLPIDPATGDIDTAITIPPGAAPGPYELLWLCAFYDAVIGWPDEPVPFTVLTPEGGIPLIEAPSELPTELPRDPSSAPGVTAANRSAELANTGFPNPIRVVIIAALLGAGGVTTVAFARRMRKDARTT